MKLALITDLHIGARKGNKTVHDYFAKFYDDVLFPYIDQHGISRVICLGDTFDVRRGIDFYSLKWAKEHVFEPLAERLIETHIIAGNHDIFHRNSTEITSSEMLLGEYPHITVYNTPTEVRFAGETTLMLPWLCDGNMEESLKMLKTSKASVVFSHLELVGFESHRGHIQTTGMSADLFSRFQRVFSGHYHCKSTQKNITYLGNVYQMYWNDVNDQRGFHVFDIETGELEFVVNPHQYYYQYVYDDTKKMTVNPDDVAGRMVKVVVKHNTSKAKFNTFIQCIESANPIDLKIIDELVIDASGVKETDIQLQDTLQILHQFVSTLETTENKDSIFEIVKSLYHESESAL